MGSVNTAQILLRSKRAIDADVNAALDMEMRDAAERYIQIFQRTLESSGVPESVEALGSELSASDPEVHRYAGTGWFNGWYKRSSLDMRIYFGGDLYRPSLKEDVFGGIDNILLLFNEGYGYKAGRNKLIGDWHGARTKARAEREALHFIEQANMLAYKELGVLKQPPVLE